MTETSTLNHKRRVEKLRDELDSKGLDGAVLFERGNVRYLTGWRQNTSSFSVVVVTGSDVAYIVPKLDEKAVRKECWIDNIHSFPEEGDVTQELYRYLGDEIEEVGIELNSITAKRKHSIESNLDIKTEPIDNVLSDLREVKSSEERKLYREGAEVTSKVMEDVLDEVEAGVRETDLTARAKYLMDKSGGETQSFEPFVMSGEHSSMPHRTPTQKGIEEGELVVFDMGLVWNGYATDITRTFSLGEVSDEKKRLFDAAYEAQREAIDAVEPGVKAEEVHEAAVNVLEGYGLNEYFPHLTGHGLGCDIHESPIIDEGHDQRLRPGMVVTIEPGVYKEGVGGARVEDMVLVTDLGHEVLTSAPRDLVE